MRVRHEETVHVPEYGECNVNVTKKILSHHIDVTIISIGEYHCYIYQVD